MKLVSAEEAAALVPDGSTVVPKNKDLITGVPRGTVYHQVANGGGGWGDPKLRDRRLLRDEVVNGVVSRASALRDYGMSEAELEPEPGAR